MSAVVLISAGTEWRSVLEYVPNVDLSLSPYGPWFRQTPASCDEPVIFFHGGWGKVAAAGSTQYAIDRWAPDLLVNLGTCGGIEGQIASGTIILADRTLIYDVVEQMGDPDEALAHYATDLDLSWLAPPLPQPVVRERLLSADRDLVVEDLPRLRREFDGVAVDWESGAIAYVADRNDVRCLILRGVTDLVGQEGGEAYDGTLTLFRERTREIMTRLLDGLPGWLKMAGCT
jgi:adenosylhomocysteine nucleosidase